MNTAVCGLCPRHCRIEDGGLGSCRARRNAGGTVVCDNYGRITSLALDPVEKKPLKRFHPGSMILSVGSYGCNLRCPFCQNASISMAGPDDPETVYMSPEQLAGCALEQRKDGNIGVAFTYNEPLVGYEYVMDTAKAVHELGMYNVLVTNGYVCGEPLVGLLPHIDAMNIDLKGFTEEYYRWLGGDLESVKSTIAIAAEHCHVEVTTLIVPGRNDGEAEMREMAGWLASIDTELALHVTRFFPRYLVRDIEPTPVETVRRLADVAAEKLSHVYVENCM